MKAAVAGANEASAQLKRLLALVPRIADGEEYAIDEIATMLGADAKTVVRDLVSLSDRYDVPGGFVEGLQVFIDANHISARTNHFLRPMRLTFAELHALDLGLAMLHGERAPSEWRAIDGARDRIRKVVAKLPGDDISDTPFAASTEHAGGVHLDIVRRALSRQLKLRIAYRRGDATEARMRTVCPYRLIMSGPVWYLVAHCEQNDAIRVFRVDRIEAAEMLTDKWTTPDLSAIDDHLARGETFVSDTSVRLRVRFSSKVARWVREHEHGLEEPDGSLVVEYPLADLDWAARHVLRYGPEAEIVDPPEARHAIRDRLRAMLA